jgi:hypothetical protein
MTETEHDGGRSPSPTARLVAHIALVLLSAGYTVYALRYPRGEWADPGPGAVPLLVGAGLVISSTVLAVREMKARAAVLGGAAPVDDGEHEGARPLGDLRRAALVLVTLFAFMVAVPYLGFLPAAAVAAVAAARVMGDRGWRGPLVIVVVTVLAYFLFEVWLLVPLPDGRLF